MIFTVVAMKESKKESKVSSSAAPLPPNTKVDQSESDAVKPEWLQPFQEGKYDTSAS